MKNMKAILGITVVCLGFIYFPIALLIIPVTYIIGFMISYDKNLKG